MEKKNKQQVIIFDLDGVLINSKRNMEISWNKTKDKYLLDCNFKKYFQNVGKPFKDILLAVGIKKNLKEIEKNFIYESEKNFKQIKLYRGVLETIKFLKKKNIKIGILTSKNKKRTLNFIKKLKIKVDFVQCPETNLRGKPYPDLFNKIIKEKNFKRSNCFYVGDTIFDLVATKRAKINFVLANYGYKIGIKKSKVSINRISQIKKIIK